MDGRKQRKKEESRRDASGTGTQDTGGREGLRIRARGRLPHWELEGGIYFVTFRLDDSVPKTIAEAYRFERENIVKTAQQMQRDLSNHERERLRELYSEQIEGYLDSGKGKCYLKMPVIAEIVKNALVHFDGQRYRLIAWCIMPNHVHVIMRPLGRHELADILHSWKSYTAKEANKRLGRKGAFWQREYYDHLIRNEKEFQRMVAYVLANPEKARLSDWQWVGLGAGQ